MIENLGAWGTFIVAVTGVLTALGVGELIKRGVARRGDRADQIRASNKEVATVSAQGNLDVLRVLLEETRDRVNGYESQIVQMRADHARVQSGKPGHYVMSPGTDEPTRWVIALT